MSSRSRRSTPSRSPSRSPSPNPTAAAEPEGLVGALAALESSELAWVVLLGWSAECLTTLHIPTIFTSTSIDATMVAINVGGAALSGAALGLENSDDCSKEVKRVAGLFRGGFIAVFTSLAWILQQAFAIASTAHEHAHRVLEERAVERYDTHECF